MPKAFTQCAFPFLRLQGNVRQGKGQGGGGGEGRVVGGEPADGGDRAGGSFAKVLAPPAPSRLYKGAI